MPQPGILGVLIRLFFSRFFDREALSPQGEPEANVVQTLGLLAAPGAFAALLFCLLPLSASGWNLVALRCLFLSFSMVVMAFIVVFEWDALFPDRRDYQILLPLPLPLWILFLAKTIALLLFLGLFLADLNFFATLFWPGIEKGSVPGVVGVHLLVVVTAGFFSALCAVCVQSLLLTFVPARMLRPVTAWVQTISITVLVMLFFLSPLIAESIHALIGVNSRLLRFVPAFWFSGLYEELRPAVGNRTLVSLGQLSLSGFGCALTVLVLTHLPGYQRHARKLVETVPSNPSGPGRLRVALSAAMDRLLLKDPIQQAIYRFISQTIGRSMKHRLFLATCAGIGAALVVTGIDRSGGEGVAALITSGQSFDPDPEGLLRIPLTLSFMLILGLRAAFSFPAELGANWAFQIGDTDHRRECLTAVRKWIFVRGIGPLFLLLSPLELAFFPWTVVLFQIFYGVTLSIFLVEIVFFDFQKIPFTCAYFPGKINLVLLAAICVTGFSLYTSTLAGLESWLMKRPLAASVFFSAAACARLILWNWRRGATMEFRLDYIDDGDPEVRTLGLTQ